VFYQNLGRGSTISERLRGEEVLGTKKVEKGVSAVPERLPGEWVIGTRKVARTGGLRYQKGCEGRGS
jgi:hypothetical protein